MKFRKRQPTGYQQEEALGVLVTRKKQTKAAISKVTTKTSTQTPKAKRQGNTIYTFATMHRLNKLYFEVYAMGKTLTRKERLQFLQSIGEKESRNFTYRLQNQSGRLADEAKAYQRLFNEGCIHNYESFLTYLFHNDVPELDKPRPSDGELASDTAQQDNSADEGEGTGADVAQPVSHA
ncbi:hypothetical protein BJV82DRAFT_582226 [Fennellomyces sp. T-0311]|nr:hypothetical protein BJV82DRAFT_582226 [Fennellomyces sp. T-0311]